MDLSSIFTSHKATAKNYVNTLSISFSCFWKEQYSLPLLFTLVVDSNNYFKKLCFKVI